MGTSKSRRSIRDRFLDVDAATVADVLDEIGLPDQGVSSEIHGTTGEKVAGWAYTIAGQMAPYGGSGDPLKMEACTGIGADEVSVWAGHGAGVCYFGELIAIGMMERGSAGAVLDGGLRDVRALREHGFSAFARYRTAVQSIGRWRVTGYQEPVHLPGATSRWVVVRPGDFVLGDEDGVVVVPQERVEDVLGSAERMTRTETDVRAALRSGTSLAEALERFGHV